MTKILAYGDGGVHTGFERVFRGIMTRVNATDGFEVVGMGIGHRGDPTIKYDFPVYPANFYGGEYFGFQGLNKAIETHKPDMLWILQDLWNITHYMSYRKYDIPTMVYFPVDTPNLKWSYAVSLGSVACPVAYTQFGAHEGAAAVQDAVDLVVEGARQKGLDFDERKATISIPHPSGTKLTMRMDYLSRNQNLDAWGVIPHGIDPESFKKLDKEQCRKEYGIEEGAFLVGDIGTNQFRKRHDTALRIFAGFAARVPEARMLLYCQGSDESGWDLQQLARYLGVYEKIFFVHDQLDRPLTTTELCEIYNCLDVMINTSGGEGWGLTATESALCGVAQMVPDWSATREIWGEAAVRIPVLDWRFEPKFLNTAHAILDVKAGIEQLYQLYSDKELLAAYSAAAEKLAKATPTWDEVGDRFVKLMYRTLNTQCEPRPRSFNEILKHRKVPIKSELYKALYMENGLPVSY